MSNHHVAAHAAVAVQELPTLKTEKNVEPREWSDPHMPVSPGLPADIAAHRVKLTAVQDSVVGFGRYMDGYLFGVVGIDGVVGLVPVVGDVFGGLMTFWLVAKAGQVRMPMGDRIVMVGLGAVDIAIGLVPVAGDVADFFFRSHGWSARRLQTHIDMQLRQIDAVASLPGDHPRMEHLRDALFRGGKTKQDVWRRVAVIGAVCVSLLGYCSYQANLEAQMRQERIVTCERGGGWFCGLR